MSSNVLPLTIQGVGLPPNVRWNPQELAEFIWSKARIVTSQSYALFVSGSTEPSSDVGPWFKNGNELWVWNSGTGSYQPITIPQASLGYIVSATPPDQSIYTLWIETTIGGSPLALKIYYSGSWIDVYATQLASYATIAAMNAAIAAGDAATLAAANAYTDAAVAGIPAPSAFAAYPAQGVVNAQTIAIDGAPHQVEFSSAPINPAPAPFNTGTFRYIAPANGYYDVAFSGQFDNDTGTPAGMQVGVALYKNGVFVGNGMADLDNTPSPTGDRWSPGFGGLVQLTAGDYLEIFAEIADGVNTGDITLTVGQLSVHRVQAS